MIVNPHNGSGLDGTVYRICQFINSLTTIVPITRINDFVFNEELKKVRDYVLVDFVELDWNWDFETSGTHFFGRNTESFPHFKTDEWRKFDEWVGANPPKVYFKRELLNRDFNGNVYPVDYPCWFPAEPVNSKEEFNSRPLECFFFWGRSHEERLRLHGDIWVNASRKGYTVCDNIIYFNAFMQNESNPHKWVTLNIPHYCRTEMANIFAINRLSKISVAMPGAGRKTFRHSESPLNSVMLMMEDNFAYSYPWVKNKNCLTFEMFGDEISEIEAALANPYLYDIYLAGVENCNNYRIQNYTADYIERIINEYA